MEKTTFIFFSFVYLINNFFFKSSDKTLHNIGKDKSCTKAVIKDASDPIKSEQSRCTALKKYLNTKVQLPVAKHFILWQL